MVTRIALTGLVSAASVVLLALTGPGVRAPTPLALTGPGVRAPAPLEWARAP
jgi:hypothetical protein